MLKKLDLYNLQMSVNRAHLKGNAAYGDDFDNTLIVYGRIGEALSSLPAMASNNLKADVADKSMKAYLLDIFAIQMQAAPNSEVLYCNGRVVALCSGNQLPMSCVALKCNMEYNLKADLNSRESNMVLACRFRMDKSSGRFVLYPAMPAMSSEMGITEEAAKFMLNNFIYPDKMVENTGFARRLGDECALCTGCDSVYPQFYKLGEHGRVMLEMGTVQNLFQSVAQLDLYPSYDNWNIDIELQRALGMVSKDNSVPRAANLKAYDFSLRDYSAITGLIRTELEACDAKLNENVTKNITAPPEDFPSRLDKILVNAKGVFQRNWNTKGFGSKGNMTGSSFVAAILRNLFTVADIKVNDVSSAVDDAMSEISQQDLLTYMFTLGADLSNVPFFNMICNEIQAPVAYCSLVSLILVATGNRMNYSALFKRGISYDTIMYLLLEKPYTLGYIYPNFSIGTLDEIAAFVDHGDNFRDVMYLRSAVMLHCKLTTLDNKAILVKKQGFEISAKYKLSAAQEQNVRERRSLLPASITAISRSILGTTGNCFVPSTMTTYSSKYETYGSIPSLSADIILKSYLDSGLGIAFKFNNQEYLIDYVMAKQFLYIYDRLTANWTVSELDCDINKLREQFEAQVGYTLEGMQAKAVNLLKYPASCLTGPAGSGKTTTLSWLIYVATRGLDISKEKISLLAPSGMAARRMAQCTGLKASTIHSGLRIFTEDYTWSSASHPDASYSPELVIFDESTMASIGLMYQALIRIPEGTRLLFGGDMEQLPAVESGKPFVDMLNFLPYIRLGISKRATADSSISTNCKTFIETRQDALISGKDAKLVQIPAENVGKSICELCAYHLGKRKTPPFRMVIMNDDNSPMLFSPNDIQIVTPVAKDKYPWSTAALNPLLQNVFNPADVHKHSIQYLDKGTAHEFRVGDRIINKKNRHDISGYTWLSRDDNSLLVRSVDILNGDIGYVVAIVPSTELSFFMTSGEDIIPDGKANALAASSYRNRGKMYMLVEYTGADGEKFLLGYCAYIEGAVSYHTTVSLSVDFEAIELAFALTTHKMEGSEAKLVISPLYALFVKRNSLPFINRNMVYTMMSRAKKGLYLLGDISQAPNSALSIARSGEAFTDRLSVIDVQNNMY